MDYQIQIEERPREADLAQVREGLAIYNRRFAGVDGSDSFAPITLLARGPDGAIVAGLIGGTYWGWLYVEILWVSEALRGQGCGSQLITQAEQIARERGCHHAHLDTMSFQAQGFYERHGYTVFGALDDLPLGHRRIFLQKRLQAPG
jgi:GNAT superfamily N-acetyltransferase